MFILIQSVYVVKRITIFSSSGSKYIIYLLNLAQYFHNFRCDITKFITKYITKYISLNLIKFHPCLVTSRRNKFDHLWRNKFKLPMNMYYLILAFYRIYLLQWILSIREKTINFILEFF